MTRLTDRQREALAIMRARETAGESPTVGTKETGIMGSTLDALAGKGLATVWRTAKPYPRLVGRLTDAGRTEADRRAER